MPTTSLTSRILNRPFLILALCLVAFLVSCDSSTTTEPPPDDTEIGPVPDPDGVLLDGDPGDAALDAIVMLPSSPVAREDVADHLLLTRLTAYINPATTVGQVNDALTTNDVRIITMWTGLPAMTLKVPRVSDRAEAEALAATLQATDAFHVVLPTREAYIDPAGIGATPQLSKVAPTDGNVPEHVLLQQFTASWHGVQAARQVNNKVTLYVPDFYYNRVPHPLIPSQVFVGEGGELSWSVDGFYPGNHGFHVAGTIGATNTSGVAGVHSDSDLTEIRSLPLYAYGFLGTIYRIAERFPSGKFVLNTSLGFNDPFFDDDSKIERARLAAIWRTLTFEISDQFFHATGAGNDGWWDEDGGESRYASLFTVSEYYSDLRDLAAEDESASQEDQDNFATLMSLLPHVDFHPDNILTVGNSANDGQKDPDSNRGANVRAIGENVKAPCIKESSRCDGTAATLSGTSMASPQVAGLAAYVMNLDPTLTPTQVRDLIQHGYDFAQTGMLPAYVIALGTDKSIASAPFRRAVLDVTNSSLQEGASDGVFDENDLELYLSQLNFYNDEMGDDYSRYDLNGNGKTRLADTGRFDLDVNNPPAWSVVNQTIEGDPVTFDENKVSDLDILCYYAFSPLYQGSADARLELLREACGIGSGEIIVSNRASWASASATVCDNLPVKESSVDYEPFAATLSNSQSCADGIAAGNIQYSDSLSFSRFGSLTGVFADGTATASATHLDDENRFIRTLGGGQGHMDGVWFQVVDQRAQFVFDGTATAAAAGPAAVAEVVVTLHSPSRPDNIWRVYVQGPDSTAGPIVWHEEGQLPPGFYAISIHVRTSGVADFRTVNTVNTASASFSCAFTFTQ